MTGGAGQDRLEVRVLGPLDLTAGGAPIQLSGPIERALMLRLALAGNRPVTQERLSDDIWGDDLPAQPRRALHAAVFRVRRALGDLAPLLAWRDQGYSLQLEPGALDADAFEALVAEARRCRAAGNLPESRDAFTAALSLWRGEALEGLRDLPFAMSRARQLDEERSSALVERVDVELLMGGHARVLPELEALASERPTDEAVCQRLIVALYRCNRQTDALGAYDRLRKRLLEDVGIDPSPALQHLELAVLRQDPSLDGPTPVEGSTLPAAVVAIAVDAPEGEPFDSKLPFALTSFIGRERELDQLSDLMARHRLVTITGTGGCGKTRLAIEAARGLSSRTTVRLVRLETLVDPDLVGATVARALGIPQRPGESVDETLVAVLSEASMTLVVDNCEHVLDACAALVHRLLESAPGLRFLATSREPLGLPGEMAWRLPSMQLPPAANDAAAIADCDAVKLFLDRASLAVGGTYRVAPDRMSKVADICSQLDGFPLAIELAATRLGSLSLDQLSLRLADRFRLLTGGYRTALPRQQTLQATMDWSYDLLDGREQKVLDRMSVFAGPFSLEAVEAVCADGLIDVGSVPDVVDHLVAKSLVAVDRTPETVSYRLLNTIRQYAQHKLDARGEGDDIRRRHYELFAALVGRAAAQLRGRQPEHAITSVNAHVDDIRAALAWELEHGEAPALVVAMSEFWVIGGHTHEGREWIDKALPAAADRPVREAAALYLSAGVLAKYEDDYAVARGFLDQALEGFERAGDADGIATCTMQLASLTMMQGDFEGALATAHHAISRFRDLDSSWGVAASELVSGNVRLLRGERARAEADFQDCLTIGRALGNSALVGEALVYLGLLAQRSGDTELALSRFEEALPLARLLGDDNLINVSILQLGVGASRRGDDERADRLLTEALEMARRRGEPLPIARILLEMAEVAMRHGDPARSEELILDALRRYRSIQSTSAIPQCLELLARSARLRGDPVRAVTLLGAAESVRQQHGLSRGPGAESSEDTETYRGHGEAWRLGTSLSTAEAVSFALRE